MDYTEELKKSLAELRAIDGFPIGDDEAVLSLSRPPYYTACPNPFISSFIKENGKPYDPDNDNYRKEPFIGDVSFGRNDPLLNAHFYHTKVPPKAICQFIEHYTEENDIILDAFAGTGTTGIAATRSNRKAIISDLSPIASFISANQNLPSNIVSLVDDIKAFTKTVESLIRPLYKLKVGATNQSINYTIWSDAFECPFCKSQYFYYDQFVDFENNKVKESAKCPSCDGDIKKENDTKVFVEFYDSVLRQTRLKPLQKPVKISYKKGNRKFYLDPTEEDLDLIKEIENKEIPHWVPSSPIMFKGDEFGDLWRAGYHKGYSHTHDFYTKRNLLALSIIFDEIQKLGNNPDLKRILTFIFSSLYSRSHRMNRYIPQHGRHVGPLSGTLYMSSLQVEINVLSLLKEKTKSIISALSELKKRNVLISNQSITSISQNIPQNSIDYIYTDPPFGDNLPYSELNFLMEDWIKLHTNTETEAIINVKQNKQLDSYNLLMQEGFKEYFKVLKPNRWITVVFHNSQSKVWTSIQDAITKAGFIISSISVLDKKKGTTKQLSYGGAVKNDLIISAFKPKVSFIDGFEKTAGVNYEKDFLETYLINLPLKPVIERTKQMLYSKMIAYYLQRNYQINQDAKSFYSLLQNNFIEEDGFWFTSDQINSYIEYKKYAKLNEIEEIKTGGLFLFVTDEKSALVWLHNFLNQPKSFSDVSVAFNQLANIQDDQVPELRDLLEENFVFEGGLYRRPKSEEEHNQITEKRQKHLWKEFETILIQAQTERKKIKEVRKEALTYGFERCYKDKRFKDILTIASKLHPSILENNGELADFVEAAEIQVDGLA
ncbi:DNA methyltransferase [Sphingobacterium sp. BS-2]|uniref:DNA methyltransferase n=1 Tax=Sphingobacterium sp. BS-2 TaxID=3377129 RepID=UPI0038FC2D49